MNTDEFDIIIEGSLRAFEIYETIFAVARGMPEKDKNAPREWNTRLYVQQDHAASSHPMSVDARAFASYRYYSEAFSERWLDSLVIEREIPFDSATSSRKTRDDATTRSTVRV